jgi:hypothetical protein
MASYQNRILLAAFYYRPWWDMLQLIFRNTGLVFPLLGILILVGFFLLPKLARWKDGSIDLKVLTLALFLKLGFAMMRYFTSFVLYGGSADASRYDRVGKIISGYLWDLNLEAVVPYLEWGTSFVEFFTGFVYSIIGHSILGGYLVFAFVSFIGSYFFYRAFRVAYPDSNQKLYGLLIFFFPSLLFWPNGIGKDSLMCFGIGLFGRFASNIEERLQRSCRKILGFGVTIWIDPNSRGIRATS